MSVEDLTACENRDVQSIDRVSDASEARADEKQDLTTSLNFPTSLDKHENESWNYLFDFAVACELLAPRPEQSRIGLCRRHVLGIRAPQSPRSPNGCGRSLG